MLVDKEGRGKTLEIRDLFRRFIIAKQTRIIDAVDIPKGLNLVDGGLGFVDTLVIQTDDGEFLLSVGVAQLNEMWDFLAAGRTPRTPDVNDEDLTLEIGFRNDVAVDTGEAEVERKRIVPSHFRLQIPVNSVRLHCGRRICVWLATEGAQEED